MRVHPNVRSVAFALTLASLLVCAIATAKAHRVEPIPEEFELPESREKLQHMLMNRDVAGMRRHAWKVWAGLTATTWRNEPVWRTWWPAAATLSGQPADSFLEPSHQLEALAKGGITRLEPEKKIVVMASVFYNDAAHQFIRAKKLYDQQTLWDLHTAFKALDLPPESRRITDFPRQSVIVKAVWFLVRGSGKTAMPVWSDRTVLEKPDRRSYPPQSWVERVMISPAVQESDDPLVVPLNRFYSVCLSTQALVDDANGALMPRLSEDKASIGDYAVLVGMHVATKELEDWVWATFWWSPTPEVGEFASLRPQTVKGIWRHFVMDVAFDADIPLEDKASNVCFNPWLEAGFTMGVTSNCVSCHQFARWEPPPDHVSSISVTRGHKPDNWEEFAKSVRLDYVWSLNRHQRE